MTNDGFGATPAGSSGGHGSPSGPAGPGAAGPALILPARRPYHAPTPPSVMRLTFPKHPRLWPMTLKDLARAMGMHFSHVSKSLSGREVFSAAALFRAARVLGLSAEELQQAIDTRTGKDRTQEEVELWRRQAHIKWQEARERRRGRTGLASVWEK